MAAELARLLGAEIQATARQELPRRREATEIPGFRHDGEREDGADPGQGAYPLRIRRAGQELVRLLFKSGPGAQSG